MTRSPQRFYIYYFGRREIVWLPWKYNARPSNNDPLEGAYIAHFVYNDQRKKPWESTVSRSFSLACVPYARRMSVIPGS